MQRQVILGGPYPHNSYAQHHVNALRGVQKSLQTKYAEDQIPHPIIDFLSASDNDKGHWREDEYEDAGHPNSKGHRSMASAIVPSSLGW